MTGVQTCALPIFTGHITFDENGDPIKTVSVLKCSNGAAVLEAKVEA